MFALVDCNNFYASCERVFRPDLAQKPIVVLSNNDGCVISRSNEAKALYVPMGAPAFKYESYFKEHNIHVFSSNYALYGDFSNRVMNMLREYTPEVEVYSIDESFLKFTGFQNLDFYTYGESIRKTIKKGTGIPVSIGIAPTKALAKLANKIAKKTGKTYVIDSEEKRLKALKSCVIKEVWGIGRNLSKHLLASNIKTAFDFTMLNDVYVKRRFSVVEYQLKKELEGTSKLAIATQVPPKKSIVTSRTFEGMLTEFNALNERLATFVVSAAEKLRKQKSSCSLLYVSISSNRMRKDLTQYRNGIVLHLEQSTNSSLELLKAVRKGLKAIYKPGIFYKRAGITLMGITQDNKRQVGLFENDNLKQVKLMRTIDEMNAALGNQKIRFGVQDLGRTWKMKQERLSPKYTTEISEILTIKV